MKNSLILATCFFLPLLSIAQGTGHPNKNKIDEESYTRIQALFLNLAMSQCDRKRKYCSFKYEKSSAPDVDVFNRDYHLILGNLDCSKVLNLVRHYCNFCALTDTANCDGTLLDKMQSFLTNSNYSTEFHYKAIDKRTSDIICLIYGG
jgi:hypothetical protein